MAANAVGLSTAEKQAVAAFSPERARHRIRSGSWHVCGPARRFPIRIASGVERMGQRFVEFAVSERQGRGPDGRRRAEADIEMGVRVSRRDLGIGTADGRRRAACSSATTTAWSIRSMRNRVHALDVQADGGVRTAITVARLATTARHAAMFGDIRANAYAIDAETGTLIWKTKVDDHAVARITGAPSYHNGRLYVPVSSIEEVAGAHPTMSAARSAAA